MRSTEYDTWDYDHYCGFDQPTPEEIEREEEQVERRIDEWLERMAEERPVWAGQNG